MSVSLYFGLPGCGKTTILSYCALKAVKGSRYNFVYSNVPLNIPGVILIDNDCIGKYELHDGLLLIDEATLFADSRAYKDFSKERLEFFLMHRHKNIDIILFTQQWDGVDRKIRVITDRVYYVFKGFLLGCWFSSIWRVPYKVIFPDDKSDKAGEIVMGYVKPNILVRLFAKKIFRPPLYKYFDSWENVPLPDLPGNYEPIKKKRNWINLFKDWFNKTFILLRYCKQYRKKTKFPFSKCIIVHPAYFHRKKKKSFSLKKNKKMEVS